MIVDSFCLFSLPITVSQVLYSDDVVIPSKPPSAIGSASRAILPKPESRTEHFKRKTLRHNSAENRMHPGAVSCLSFSDEQLLVSGSSLGSISISDLSSDQRVVTLVTANYAVSIKSLCLNPSSNSLFAGLSTGHVSRWDLRTLRRVWETRVSPNVIYPMHHLCTDKSTLVVGGIDGVLRTVDHDSREVLSRWMTEQKSNSSLNRSTVKSVVFEKKKAT